MRPLAALVAAALTGPALAQYPYQNQYQYQYQYPPPPQPPPEMGPGAPVQAQPLFPPHPLPPPQPVLPPLPNQGQDQGIEARPLAPPPAVPPQPVPVPAPPPGAAAQPPTPPPAVAPPAALPSIVPPQWVPRATAELEVLDKVEAVSRTLSIAVGQSAPFGSLTIAVKACDVRPADMAQDAAAYLVITDSHTQEAGFRGWMLKNEPWLDMMQSPLYDVRVMGCR